MDLREKEIGKERKKEICLGRKREHKILKSNFDEAPKFINTYLYIN